MGHDAMKRPAGSSSGAAGLMGRARFLPRALVELREEAASSMAKAAATGAAAGAAVPAMARAEFGEGPSPIEAQGSPSDEEEAGPPTEATAVRATRAGTPPSRAGGAGGADFGARPSSAAAQGSRGGDRVAVGKEAACPEANGAAATQAPSASATLPRTTAGAARAERAGGGPTATSKRGPAAAGPGSGAAKTARA